MLKGGKTSGSLYFFAGGTLIWCIGYNAKTPYKKWVTKNGKKYYVEYNPSAKLVKFGNKCCYVGNWSMGHVSKLYNIISGINGFLKLK